MKIAILNDTHCGIRNSSDIFLNNAANFYDKIFFPECEKREIKHIIHLGDYYDHRKFVNFKALNHNRKHFLYVLSTFLLLSIVILWAVYPSLVVVKRQSSHN